MSNIIVDLSNYKDRVGQRVEPGRYRVLVEDAEQDTSKSGNTMITLWLRISEGEFDGSTVIDRLVMTPNSLFRVVGFMQAVGIPTPKKRLSLKLAQFVGKSLIVDIDDGEPYAGRIKSEVRGYLKLPKAEAAEVKADGQALESATDSTIDLESLELG